MYQLNYTAFNSRSNKAHRAHNLARWAGLVPDRREIDGDVPRPVKSTPTPGQQLRAKIERARSKAQ